MGLVGGECWWFTGIILPYSCDSTFRGPKLTALDSWDLKSLVVWRSKRTLRHTDPNPSFLEGPMILRVKSYDEFYRKSILNPLNPHILGFGFLKFSRHFPPKTSELPHRVSRLRRQHVIYIFVFNIHIYIIVCIPRGVWRNLCLVQRLPAF